MHHTKDKGDLALAKAIVDLTEKGYTVFTPAVSEHSPVDLIGLKDNKCYRFQAKYFSSNEVPYRTSWSDKSGTHIKFYNDDDFDYYALYVPDIKVMIYPSIKYGGITIRTESKPLKNTKYWWYEDFLELTDAAEKRQENLALPIGFETI